MTDKQQRFVDEYLVDLNATQAAIRAGYSPKTAYAKGCGLLKKPEIVAAIANRQAELREHTGITQEYVVNGFQEIAERCMQKAPVMVFDKVEREYVQAQDDEGRDIWQFDATNANRAFENLGKHLGIYAPEKRDLTTNGQSINVVEIVLTPEET